MKVLITGAAGFIGATLAIELLGKGVSVVGIDNMNDYYDVNLKKARLERVRGAAKGASFVFHEISIADKESVFSLASQCSDVTHIVNLAAQAGVRYSLVNPFAYIETNALGFVVMLELARKLPALEHFVYASSSSVYGGNTKTPFAVEDPVERPLSLYAATKRADELMAHTYAHLYGLPCTGLRFFTVYGPWGRPDMAAYLFTANILADKPIPVFNNGNLRRDFTYIDDIVSGVAGVLNARAPSAKDAPPCRVYNLGNSRSESLMEYISLIEQAVGKKARCDFLPMQPGDVPETFADIAPAQKDFGYAPVTSIHEGIPRFVAWYKKYHAVL